MPQQFKINSVEISRITKGDWLDEPGDAQALDGVTPLARWRRHTWTTEVLSASEFNSLYSLEGQQVSLDTPPYDDRNAADYQRYYGAILQSVTGNHDGSIFTGVSCEFLVRL